MLEDIERIEVISGPGRHAVGRQRGERRHQHHHQAARATRRARSPASAAGNRETQRRGALRRRARRGGHYRVYAKSADRGNAELRERQRRARLRAAQQAGFRADWEPRGAIASRCRATPTRARWTRSDPRARSRAATCSRAGPSSSTAAPLQRPGVLRPHRPLPPEPLRGDARHLRRRVAARLPRGRATTWSGAAGYREARDEIDNSAGAGLHPGRPHAQLEQPLRRRTRSRCAADLDLTLGAQGRAQHATPAPSACRPCAWRGESPRASSRGARSRARCARPRASTAMSSFPGSRRSCSTAARLRCPRSRTWPSSAIAPAPRRSFSYSVTAFHHDYDRLRSVGLAERPAGVRQRHRGHASSGVEAWGTLAGHRHAGALRRLRSRCTRRIEVKPGGIDLGGRPALGNDPEHWAKLRSSWTPTPRHEVDVFVRHYGALATGVGARVHRASTRASAGGSRSALELSLALQNLFDDKHIEWGAPASSQPSARLPAR